MSTQARITALLVAMNGVIENEDLPEESLEMLSLIRERTEGAIQAEMVLMRKLLAEHKQKEAEKIVSEREAIAQKKMADAYDEKTENLKLREETKKEVDELHEKINYLNSKLKEKELLPRTSSRGGVRLEGTSIGALWIENKLKNTKPKDCHKCVGCPKVFFSPEALTRHRKKCVKTDWKWVEDTPENRKYWRRS